MQYVAKKVLWRVGLVLVALGSVPGCSDNSGAPVIGQVYKVSGRVVLNGEKPLSGGRIYFVHEGGALTSEANVEADGSFSLSTGLNPGAPEGRYRVRLEPSDPSLMANLVPSRRGKKAGKRLPFAPKYLDEDSSGLIAVIEAHDNQLQPFRLN